MSSNGHDVLRRMVSAELNASEGRILEGCCAPYGQPATVQDPGGPAYTEVFERGAFQRAVRAPNRVQLLFEHRDGLTDRVGRALELREEDGGLFGSFKVVGGMIGDHALALCDEGMLEGFSVGFVPLGRARRNADGHVVRSRCHLADVSLVPEPAYAGAGEIVHRSREELAREFELPENDEAQTERLRLVGITISLG